MANRFQIGGLEVLVVSDGKAEAPGTTYFPMSSPEKWEPHKRWLNHNGNVEFPFTCFVIRSGGKTVLIDTGLGPVQMWTFKGGALLDELAGAGVRPADIDIVFVTHLHVDHCGTVALPDGEAYRPTFPKATYRWTATDDAHWRAAPLPPGTANFSAEKMFAAVAGRYEPAQGGTVIAPGINVIDTPGHTPGHAGVVLSSAGKRAFILGDAISCPVQLEETEWSGLGDMDPKLARQSQEAVLREMEGSEDLLTAAHFPGLTFGRVLVGEGRRYWQAV
ncbi:MAG: MBL fold metallo-hydrolase [Dehalococcoidia bacterium]|nr:MBL fold metallo-hydrolase [Dehalococcoidia bacterium]